MRQNGIVYSCDSKDMETAMFYTFFTLIKETVLLEPQSSLNELKLYVEKFSSDNLVFCVLINVSLANFLK